MEWEESKKTYLARKLFGAALAIGVGLFNDPLAALVRIRERMSWWWGWRRKKKKKKNRP